MRKGLSIHRFAKFHHKVGGRIDTFVTINRDEGCNAAIGKVRLLHHGTSYQAHETR